jgi:hypothetical protein
VLLSAAPGTGTLVGSTCGNLIGLAATIEDIAAGDTEVVVGAADTTLPRDMERAIIRMDLNWTILMEIIGARKIQSLKEVKILEE